MRVRTPIPISMIQMDRWPIGPRTLALIHHLEGGGGVPPIKLQKLENGTFRIRDGRHRLLAFKMLGRKVIIASYGELRKPDPFEFPELI